ncbi:hypothetical protein ACQP1W_37860 [Spirillospora sp. CA-255316]
MGAAVVDDPAGLTPEWLSEALGGTVTAVARRRVGARDLSYFLCTSLEPDDRAEHERTLVEAYRTALARYGVKGYDPATCFEDYRFAALQGPLITVLGCGYGARTERGDEMFLTMAARSCAAIRELGSLDLI